jgi:hypothetical protein
MSSGDEGKIQERKNVPRFSKCLTYKFEEDKGIANFESKEIRLLKEEILANRRRAI